MIDNYLASLPKMIFGSSGISPSSARNDMNVMRLCADLSKGPVTCCIADASSRCDPVSLKGGSRLLSQAATSHPAQQRTAHCFAEHSCLAHVPPKTLLHCSRMCQMCIVVWPAVSSYTAPYTVWILASICNVLATSPAACHPLCHGLLWTSYYWFWTGW